MSAIKIALVHLSYYPTHWLNTLMCGLGFWRRWDWIDPDVAVGMMPRVKDLAVLKSQGVGAIVNMCEEFGGHVEKMARLGMTQLHLPTVDYHCPSEEHLREGVAFIRERVGRGEKVYVHCKAGRGRSATLGLCYLMMSQGISAREAHRYLKKVRRQVDGGIAERDAVLRFERSAVQLVSSQS
jgi:atypical dual specificity phosphatase